MRQELAEARAELEEKEFSHSIETQQEALDTQLDNYTETREAEIEELQATLDNEYQIISDSFEAVKANSELIGQEILAMAQEHGVQMSAALTDAWFTGENAIASYGETLSAESSNFIGNIQNVEFQVWELQNQANETAIGLSDMFATRADNLVDELTRSYYSEGNLQAMTNALGDALSNTIDGSYSGASAQSALEGIADAARDVASAANEAAQALANMGAASAGAAADTTSWDVSDSRGNLLYSTTDANSARAAQESGYRVKRSGNSRYATGTKGVSRDELAWTQERGPEMIISPSTGAILTPLHKSDAVLPADQTANMWEWSKFDPTEFAKNLLEQTLPAVTTGGNVANNTMNVGSMLTIQGSVNDVLEMVKIASQEANRNFTQKWNELNKGIH